MFRRVIFYIGGMKGHTIEEDKFLLKRSINNSLKLLRVCFIRKKKKKKRKIISKEIQLSEIAFVILHKIYFFQRFKNFKEYTLRVF